jgi:hypothetical protein
MRRYASGVASQLVVRLRPNEGRLHQGSDAFCLVGTTAGCSESYHDIPQAC